MWLVNQVYILSKSICWLRTLDLKSGRHGFGPQFSYSLVCNPHSLLFSLLSPSLPPSLPLLISFIQKYLLNIYCVLGSCHRLVGQLAHIPEGEHGKFIGKKFVMCSTS